jgi:hypothetical protein
MLGGGGGGGSAESHISPDNSTTAIILVHCNKEMQSPPFADEAFLFVLNWVALVELIL